MSLLLFINNTPITVNEQVTVVRNSPVFNDAGTTGSYIFNFKVPLTDDIKKAIGYLNNHSVTKKNATINVRLATNHINFDGLADVVSVNDKTLEISIPLENGVLAQELKKFNLNDLNLEENIKTYDIFARASASCNANRNENTGFSDNKEFTLNGIYEIWGTSVFYCPQSQTYKLDFELNILIYAGQNFKLKIYRTIGSTKTLYQSHDINIDDNYSGYFASSDSKILSVTAYLILYDMLSFEIEADSEYFPQYTVMNNKLNYTTRSDTCYINFTYNSNIYQYSIPQHGYGGYPVKNFTFFPIHNPSFYKNASENNYVIDDLSLNLRQELFPVVNYFNNNSFPLYVTGKQTLPTQRYYAYNTFVPLPYLGYLFVKIFEKAGIQMNENIFLNNKIRTLCLVSSNAINIFDHRSGNPPPQKFNLSDYLPEINAAEFVSDICQTLGIACLYDHSNKVINFYFLEDVMTDPTSEILSNRILNSPSLEFKRYDGFNLSFDQSFDCDFRNEYVNDVSLVNYKGEVINFVSLPTSNNTIDDCWFVSDIKVFYYWNFNSETDKLEWKVYSVNFHMNYEKIFINNPTKSSSIFKYVLPITPLVNVEHPRGDQSFGSTREWLIPAYDSPGHIKSLPKPKPSYGIAYYRNYHQDSNGNVYPMGSSGYRNYNNSIIFYPPMSLRIDHYDEGSLYIHLLEKYINWRSLTEGYYTFYADMKSSDLLKFDFSRWYNVLGVDYLIKEVTYELINSEYILAKFTAVNRHSITHEVPEFDVLPAH